MSIIEMPSGALFDTDSSQYLYPDAWMVEQGYMCLKIIDGEPVIRITELGVEYMRDRLRSEAQG
jgi:hypothetical protein